MADNTKIEWADATWNPITGCSVVSPGCTNCYAMDLAGTRLKHHPSRAGLTVDTKAGPVWNGQVRLNEAWLAQPIEWKRPRRIFVCAHGDLFAENVPDAWIDRVFAVMALAPHHTFQVLTKRSARMRAYLSDSGLLMRLRGAVCRQDIVLGAEWASDVHFGATDGLPLFNVWLGVSAEDQRRADERVPDLLATPAAIRFVSAEPLLGPIRFDQIRFTRTGGVDIWNALSGFRGHSGGGSDGNSRLDLIIVGGESGPDARPMHPDWVRAIRDPCAAAAVAFFFKQWGAWHPWGQPLADGSINLRSFGKDPERYRHMPPQEIVSRVGKNAAGRRLDGVEHDDIPEVRP